MGSSSASPALLSTLRAAQVVPSLPTLADVVNFGDLSIKTPCEKCRWWESPPCETWGGWREPWRCLSVCLSVLSIGCDLAVRCGRPGWDAREMCVWAWVAGGSVTSGSQAKRPDGDTSQLLGYFLAAVYWQTVLRVLFLCGWYYHVHTSSRSKHLSHLPTAKKKVALQKENEKLSPVLPEWVCVWSLCTCRYRSHKNHVASW